jgi:alkylation response protein AidB-like acyl-CoA dehydrogenase
VLFCGLDDGSGEDKRCVVLVPMDAVGVSRGLPLDKMGQRALPQGEVYFDQVRVLRDHLLAGPADYVRAEQGILTEANALMGTIWTGTARAACEMAHAYAHERKQGGVPIIQHQNVRYRLFHMFARVEACARAGPPCHPSTAWHRHRPCRPPSPPRSPLLRPPSTWPPWPSRCMAATA